MIKISQKIIALFVAAFMLSTTIARADEGMWLLSKLKQINEADMQGMGLKLSADDIYNINKSCLKDAIVQMGTVSGNSFGGFCTAEIVSDQGLLLTNHHCGFEAIQEHSSTEHDYIKDGFWAMTKEQELPNPGLGVRILVRMEDVSPEVLKQLSDTMSEASRNAALPKIYAAITKKATDGTTHTADVKAFYKGSEFYLFVYQIYRDVRLVGAPPDAIGNYGGDTDNWMWPRHTGDFSVFRIYADKENKAAAYSKDNVPYKPKQFLQVSMSGIKPTDFSMIIGFPGRTDRYLTADGVRMALDQTNDATVKVRTEKLNIMEAAMQADHAVDIQYAAKHDKTSNYWKYFIGQTKQLKKNRVVETKEELEGQFTNWVNADNARKSKYGNLLKDMNETYTEARKYNLARTYLSEAVLQGPELISFAYGYSSLQKLLENKKTKTEDIKAMTDQLKAAAKEHFKDINTTVDRDLFAALIKMYHENVPADQQPSLIEKELKANKGSYTKWAEALYSKSMFASEEKLMAFLDKPSAKKIANDPGYFLAFDIMTTYSTNVKPKNSAVDLNLSQQGRLWIEGLREMQPTKNFYPDANSTIRLTYGTVKDYNGADAVSYSYYTTLDGVMEKMDNTTHDFRVPDKLVELYKKKDYGQYAKDSIMNVAFISTNDITGGNSGSGILNAKGELIGLAFDGNWEAMSGDIYYDPKLKRCINVDIRYVLFVIDKVGGAGHLVKEMQLNN